MGMRNFLGRIFKRARVIAGTDWIRGSNNLATGRYISHDEALTVSSVYRAISLLSQSFAMLPVFLYKNLPAGGRDKFDDHPLWNILRVQPNPLQDSFQFFEMAMVHCLMKGNFYAQKIRNGRQQMMELYPLHPDCVMPLWLDPADENSLVYQVRLPGGQTWTLLPDEILHVRGLGLGGVKGLSVLDLAMQSIGIATAQEEHAANFFGKGVRASGVLEHPNKLTKEAAGRLKDSFTEAYAGSENAYRTILLEEGTKWTQTSISHEASQFIESREFSVADLARWFGVPPHMIGDLRRATFTNIEHQSLEFVTYSLGPWLTRFERAMTRQLLSKPEQKEITIEFLVNALVRGDLKTRYDAYGAARQGGWMSVDEIRALENMNPLPGGKGKIYLEPLNMKPAGTPDPKLNPPATPADPPADPAPTDPPPKNEGRTIRDRAWRNVIRSRIERALRREVTARQRPKGDDGNMLTYLPSELREDIRGLYLSQLSELDGGREERLLELNENCGSILNRFAFEWCDRSRENLESLQNWATERADPETDNLLKLVDEHLKGARDGQ